jgi:hypothetical protein
MEFHSRKNFSGIDAPIEQILETFGFADQIAEYRTGKPSLKDALAGAIMANDQAVAIDSDNTAWHFVRDLIVETAMFVVRTEAEKNDGDGDQRNGDGELGQGIHSAG